MTPLEKLAKIGESLVSLEIIKYGWETANWSWVIHDRKDTGRRTIGQGSTPEEAIDAAYKELFPPILKKVGSWEWLGGKDAVWGIPGHGFVQIKNGHYAFSMGLRDYEIRDFLDLIKANPNLLPPTE